MYNPFSFIPQFAKRWTDGIRFDLLKTFGALIIWLPSIFLLKTWNQVDTWNDIIAINAYRTHFSDSTEIFKGDIISINHPYMAFSNIYEQKYVFDYRIFTTTCNKNEVGNDNEKLYIADFLNSHCLKSIKKDSVTAIYVIDASLYVNNNDKKIGCPVLCSTF